MSRHLWPAAWLTCRETNRNYNSCMARESNTAVLDQLLGPLTDCFTPEVARRIAALRAPVEVQTRLDELADKCSDGTLTPDDRSAYEACVRAVNFIGVLQAKARAILADDPTHS